MSSPLTIYVAAFSGLKMEIHDDDIFGSGNVSATRLGFDCAEPHTYRLMDPHGQFHLKNSGRDLPSNVISGKLSPTNKVTLPPATRKRLGIHEKAMYYAYAHPPKDFADFIDWSKYNFTADIDDDDDDDDDGAKEGFLDDPNPHTAHCYINFDKDGEHSTHSSSSERSMSESQTERQFRKRGMFPVLGAYVYFDEFADVLSVNVLTLAKTKKQLPLTGPYRTPPAIVDAMCASDRIGVVPFEQFHEASIVAMGWIRPNEKLAAEPLIKNREHRHGAFIMLRHDNTAVTYTVEKESFIDYDGESGIIPDVYDAFYKANGLGQFSPACITSNFVDSSEIKKWRTYINGKVMGMKSSQASGRPAIRLSIPRRLEGETSLIHEAARSGVSLENIKILLKDQEEMESLGIQDACGWNPLQYACAFQPQNFDLINLFIRHCPDSVLQKDRFGRYPLHLACDASAPASVIKLLLKGKGRGVVLEPTVYLKRLPLHISLNCHPDLDVVSALLEADESGRSIRQETSLGCRPLHSAVARRASPALIQLLLDADSSIANGEVDNSADIMSYYRGRLPLHIACLNGCSKDIVSLLLEKDVDLSTLTAPCDAYSKVTVALGRNRLLRRSITSSIVSGSRGKVALDIAIARRREDILRLLLQRQGGESVAGSFICPDSKGRYPLHMACNANLSPDIISKMLHLDPQGVAVCHYDSLGLKPIQYACDHEHAQSEVVAMLLEAEDMSPAAKVGAKEIKYTNFGNKSALWFAARANAPVEVLDLLMSRDEFTFEGFERKSTRLSLALMIQKYPILQKRLNSRMAKRLNFTYLFLRLIVFLLLIFAFYYAIEKLIVAEYVPEYCREIIYFGSSVLTAAEAIQVMNQGARTYFVDLWNWYEIINIVFLFLSSQILSGGCYDEECMEDADAILVTTSILLILNILFFLRTTFYPFALFATGLMTIAVVVLPFLIVSTLVLIAFVGIYRIRSNFGDYDANPACKESFASCLYFILNNFFGGPDDTADLLDIVFGVIVVVILLNVVIAIVSDAWEDAKTLTATTFWQSRVDYLAETGFDHNPKFFSSFFDWLDSLRFVPINDQAQWTKEEPYKSVRCKEQHDNPRHYFVPEDALKIEEARSLASTLYWVRAKGLDARENAASIQSKLIPSAIHWFLGNVTYIVFIVIGIPTLGILWPRDWRTRIISVNEDKERKTEKND